MRTTTTAVMPTVALLLASACIAPGLRAQPSERLASTATLKKLSIEELMDLEITSVSRRPERLIDAPAAIQVLSHEDIRRAGVTNLASALRLANNLDVAQENGHEWVISARGFSSDVGNKLLVLMDGRTLYTPLFSGVFWDRQDYVLEDIDRIEIISGPGGALWGANAVNGVINITTRSAHDTHGLHLEAGGGTNPRSFVTARYGAALDDSTSWRVYSRFTDRADQSLPDGSDARDAWHMGQGGFRLDSQRTSGNMLTLQGDLYRNEVQIQTGGEATVTGANLLGRWSRELSPGSSTILQLYFDRTDLELAVPAFFLAPAGTFADELDTFDVDFQHTLALGARHQLVWGLGYRFTHDVVTNAPGLAFFPETLDQHLFSVFVQDDIELRDNFILTLGTKVEHTDYTGFEFEPNIRAQWNLAERHSLWAAVSRAVRTPSRIDRDIAQPSPEFFIVVLQGGAAFESENLLAWELGYRAQPGPRVSAALATFYNEYEDLRSTSISPPDPLFGLPFPFFFENNLEGETYGFELSATFQALERWRLHGAYRLLQESLRVKPGRFDFNNALNETADPQQQLTLRSSVDFSSIELDTIFRWVDSRIINDAGVARTVPDYAELDVRLGWNVTPRLELSLVGQNLLHDHHPEFGVPGPTRVELERSVHAKAVWRGW